jgi:hypothetical protein
MNIKLSDLLLAIGLGGIGLFLSSPDCPGFVSGMFVAMMALFLFIVMVAEAAIAELKK